MQLFMITFLSKADVKVCVKHTLIVCSSQIMRRNQLSFRFMTRKGRNLCAPTAAQEQWVQENIKFLDTRLKKCKQTKFSVCNLPQIYSVARQFHFLSCLSEDIKPVAQQACHCYCTGHFPFSGFPLTHDIVYMQQISIWMLKSYSTNYSTMKPQAKTSSYGKFTEL